MNLLPCGSCGAPIDCTNINPFDLYSLGGDNFPFVSNCPPGYDCSATNELRMICCGQELVASIPPGTTTAQRRAITQKLWSQCAVLLDFCGDATEAERNNPIVDPPVDLFYNRPQTCKKLCPDGVTEYTYTTQAGMYLARTQGLADTSAYEFACQQVALNDCPPCRAIELTALGDSLCLANNYVLSISAIGDTVAQPPATNIWTLLSGSIPTGMIMFGGTIAGPLIISGIPSAAGTFAFVVQVQVSPRCVKSKSYSLTVRGITTADPLPDAAPDVPYTKTLAATGFGGATWNIVSGTLPTGLALSSGGIISGTPTQIGDFAITVSVTDGSHTCTKIFNLAVFNFSGKRINAWKQWCGFTSLLNEFSPTDCQTPTDPPCVPINPGDCDCPQLPTPVCNIRWLTKTVHSVWNNSYYHNDPGTGHVPGVDDTYVNQFQRLNCDSGNVQVSETHIGEWIGDPYDEATAQGTILTGDLTKPFVWDVEIISDTEFKVNISFWLTNGVSFFEGYQHITLFDPYPISDLQTDLQDLWAAVNPDDYAWENDVFDIDVTYRANQAIVQYCPNQPDVIPSGGKIKDIFAEGKCAAADQNLITPTGPLASAQDPRLNYNGALLFSPSAVAPSPFPCVNMAKTILRYKGLYCLWSFGKGFPTDGTPTACDPAWNAGTVTPTIQTSLAPFTILPIAGGTPYSAGFKSVTRTCELIEWWKMEEPLLTPRDGSVLDISLFATEPVGGSIAAAPGKIDLAAWLESPSNAAGIDNAFLTTAMLPSLKYDGFNPTGLTICGWFKRPTGFITDPADVFTVSWDLDVGGQYLRFYSTGGFATAEVLTQGNPAVTATAVLTPTADTWIFFSVSYDRIAEVVTLQINADAPVISGAAGTLNSSNNGQLTVDFISGTPATAGAVVVDELGVFRSKISADTATFLYNSGSGRTYPFA